MKSSKPRSSRHGFTMVEILIVVAIIGMLLGVATPQFLTSRRGAYARNCQHSMKQILGAKERWAMENNKGATDTPDWPDLTPFFVKRRPWCPAGGNYAIGRMDELPVCDIGGVRGEWNAHVLP